MSGTGLWLILIAMGLVTFLLRYSFIGLYGKLNVPSWLEHALRFVPAAVLAALVAPALIAPQGEWLEPTGNPRLWAGVLAGAVAWRSGNIVYTMAAGMGALWLLQALL